jgi:hypothetical protein
MDLYTVKSASTALSASTTKTLLQIITPSSIRARLANLHVSFDGSTAGQAILVELLTQTTAGTSTATPAINPTDPAAPASLVTAGSNHSAEPTAGIVELTRFVRPDGGSIDIPFYAERMPTIPISGRLGVRVTTAVGVTPNATAEFSFWS